MRAGGDGREIAAGRVKVNVALCDNCNRDNGGASMTPVRLVVGSTNLIDSLANTRFRSGRLCTKCVVHLRRLDLAGLIERHENRPRSLPLP